MDIQLAGSKKKKIEISEAVFACKYNEPLVHQVVTAFLAAARAGSGGCTSNPRESSCDRGYALAGEARLLRERRPHYSGPCGAGRFASFS